MTLFEYYRAFQDGLPTVVDGDLPREIAACITAGYAVGLSLEQLRVFLARRAVITSVTIGLVGETTSPETIEKIISARQSGAIYAKEILATFPPSEVRAEFHGEFHNKE